MRTAPSPGSGWIQTFTGRPFSPVDPDPEDIVIEDIAHALSNLCRFAGHVRQFYSVAQHSVLVSELVERSVPREFKEFRARWALLGLLHDAAEAYVVDLPSPIKHLPELAGFRHIEHGVERAVEERFDLHTGGRGKALVKEADFVLLLTEARDLMAPLYPAWIAAFTPKEWASCLTEVIVPLDPGAAKALFLARFKHLQPGRFAAPRDNASSRR